MKRCNEQERDVQTSAQQARQRIVSESADCAVLKAKINKATTTLAELKAVTRSAHACLLTACVQVPPQIQSVVNSCSAKARELNERSNDINAIKRALLARAGKLETSIESLLTETEALKVRDMKPAIADKALQEAKAPQRCHDHEVHRSR